MCSDMHKTFPLLLVVVTTRLIFTLDRPDFVYHDHAALTRFLKDLVSDYPDIAHLRSIGKSVKGKWYSDLTFIQRKDQFHC